MSLGTSAITLQVSGSGIHLLLGFFFIELQGFKGPILDAYLTASFDSLGPDYLKNLFIHELRIQQSLSKIGLRESRARIVGLFFPNFLNRNLT